MSLVSKITEALQQIGNDLKEVKVARGSNSSLNERISNISKFARMNAGQYTSGKYYDNSLHGGASSTLAGAANRIEMYPFFYDKNFTISEIGVSVSTLIAGALGKIVIYDCGVDGWPNNLLYESETNLNFGSTGYKFNTLIFTFESGKSYWLGVRHSANATLRTINIASAANLGIASSNAANYFTAIRRTLTFATPSPSVWSFVSSDLVANIAPTSIRFRVS